MLSAVLRSRLIDNISAPNRKVTTNINQTATPGIIDDYSIVSKITMMFLMLAGRLEIYPVILIFFKSFWKNDNDFL